VGSVLKFNKNIFKYKVKYIYRNDEYELPNVRYINARDILEATKLACVDKEVWVVSVSQED
jgi:hypothetical protein